jgi:hypothetical protein
MNRKETLGRLLLTLLTAFVMVGAAFVSAAPHFLDEGEPSSVAVRELDEETRVAGEAPVSATDIGQETFASEGSEITEGDLESLGESAPAIQRIFSDHEIERQESLPSEPSTTIEESGTRAATVDAGGPYGTQANPYYEGNPVNFVAQIAGDINDNYKFRWDLDNDGEYEGPGAGPDYWGAYGDNDLNYQFNDNNIGQAKVEAWDGVSYVTLSGGGDIWAEDYPPGWYMYAGYYGTVGHKFSVSQTITIDELGACRLYYPYQYYNIRLWTAGGSLLRSVSYPYIPYYSWRWFSISPITIPAGEYVVSVGFRGYYQCGDDNPGLSADGIIEPLEWVRYYYSAWNFPSQSMGASPIPYVDFKYSYSYSVPDVMTDTADVFVDNVAPIAINPIATMSVGQEGSDVGFTGWMMDPGLDDDWEYRWDWGDGTISDWKKVNKYAGGAKVLLYHSVAGYEDELYDSLALEFGENAPIFDMWSFYDDPGTLDMLLEYDVIIMPENTGIIGGWPDDVGDLLADYVDAGGAVVDLVATFYNGGTWGISGRWADDEYSAFTPGYIGGSSTTSTLYWANEPGPAGLGILDGVAGTVSSWGTSIPISTYGVRPDATLLADYPYYRAAAYKHAGAMGPGSGRIVSLNIFCIQGYRSGDALKVIANAAFWASGKAPPTPLPMPIQLDTMYHTYKDDHPATVTPSDVFDVTLQIRDDDHLKEVMVGSPILMMDEDFEGVGYSWPPGWYEGGIGGWQMHYAYELDGMAPFLPFWYYGVSILYSPVMDFTGAGGAILDWDNYWWTGWGGAHQDGYVQFSIDGGATWTTVQEYHHNDPTNEVAHYQRTFGAAANEPWVQLRFWCDMYNDWYWEIDNVEIWAANLYQMYGWGEAATQVTIENVFPTGHASIDFKSVVEEMEVTIFAEFTLTDPALREKTETFWWRWDWEDGSPLTRWEETNQLIPGAEGGNLFVCGVPFDFPCAYGYSIDGAQQLLANMLYFSIEDVGTVLYMDTSWFGSTGIMNMMESTINSNFGRSYDWTYTTGTEPLLDAFGDPAYDVLYFGYDWAYQGTPPYDVTEIGDYIDAGGHVIVTGDEFGYGELDFLPWFVEYSGFDPYMTFPGPAYLDWPADIISAGVSTGEWGFNYELHNTIDDHDWDEFVEVFADPDPITTLVRVGEARYKKNTMWTETHQYGDNGIYYVDLQLIDDDMYWDLTGPQPVFVGPAGEDPYDWISHNIFPVEVKNTDPVIGGISAVAPMDLSLRVTGTPGNEATMTLFYDGVAQGSVVRDHDGNNQVAVLPVVLDVLNINKYHVEVEYDFMDDGGNPTWIFEGRFSSGHTKELKHVFKEGSQPGNIWTIGADVLRGMLLGEEIIFSAPVRDYGSDDVVFLWNFGDGTPFGVHIYANVDQGTAIDGISDEGTVIFDQLPVREPWFDYMPNNIRSPAVNPVGITDMISHAFDEDQPYYYYVTLVVLDDDVGDGYPSTELHLLDGSDAECAQVDLR